LVVSTALSEAAAQQLAPEFKTFKIVVGFSTGGGYDTYARVLARHMSRYIPGQPNIIVQNMPGGASLKAIQYLDNGAPTDGSVITRALSRIANLAACSIDLRCGGLFSPIRARMMIAALTSPAGFGSMTSRS
jgi:tripartite-type tricarboxylate transporter receptor subunit TctC